MGAGEVSPLAGWTNFYVIVGSAGAALTGLQFVVMTLAAQRNRGSSASSRAFGTPTIVHFCLVLFIAAVLAAPWRSLLGAALLLGACGAGGLAYAAWIIRALRRQTDYRLVLEDWVCHVVLPPLGHAALLASALMLQRSTATALFLVAATALLFLFVGIHNAWDAAAFIAMLERD